MKKIININFHSRVIPIEETAYEILGRYIESLRSHFSKEEGGDEIVNDIENRFAELFSENLKKGATCITDEDVNTIIASMGRPEDFDEEAATAGASAGGNSGASAPGNTSAGYTGNTGGGYGPSGAGAAPSEEPKRLYRSENDKMIAGICGGVAAYLRIDSSVVRIIFALISLGTFGTALLLYIILWVVLPPKSMVTNIRKRLYRNPDQRVIGGVASGLAAYFHIEVWIPRLIFALPLILGFLTSIFRRAWFDFDGPVFFTGGIGGSLFVTYVILWIVLPEATTPSEKLEMRGEKIDLESIKNTFRNDMEGFKSKAAKVGVEMKEQAQVYSETMKNEWRNRRVDRDSIPRRHQGFAHMVGVLFRAFFLFIAIVITFALVMALIGLMFTGAGVLPLKHFIFHGSWQNVLAWAVLILFLILPVVGLMTFLIRRIFGIRRSGNYLGYTFGGLWLIGLICFCALIASLSSDFRTRSGVSDDVDIKSPSRGRLLVRINELKSLESDNDWMGVDWERDAPFYQISEDSIMLSTVRIDVQASKDSGWHMHREKMSRGNNAAVAREAATEIRFDPEQRDSVLYLPAGFAVRPEQSFRNQQVRVVIEVPVGKRIRMDGNLDDYHWFNIRRHWRHRDGDNIQWGEWDTPPDWSTDVDYLMTENGLQRIGGAPLRAPKNTGNSDDDEEEDDIRQKAEEDRQRQEDRNKDATGESDSGGYRYHATPAKPLKTKGKSVSANTGGETEFLSALEALTRWS